MVPLQLKKQGEEAWMHKADNGMVRSLQVSGEYVVIGYETAPCGVARNRGRRRGCTRRTTAW